MLDNARKTLELRQVQSPVVKLLTVANLNAFDCRCVHRKSVPMNIQSRLFLQAAFVVFNKKIYKSNFITLNNPKYMSKS
jgi:hypothetical protein